MMGWKDNILAAVSNNFDMSTEESKQNSADHMTYSRPVSDSLKGIKKEIASKSDPDKQAKDNLKHRRPFPESLDARDATTELASLRDEEIIRQKEREERFASTTGGTSSSGGSWFGSIRKIVGFSSSEDSTSKLPQKVAQSMKGVKESDSTKSNPSDESNQTNRRPFPESRDAKAATPEVAALRKEEADREDIRRQDAYLKERDEKEKYVEESKDLPAPVSDRMTDVKSNIPSKKVSKHDQENRRPMPESIDQESATKELAALHKENKGRYLLRKQDSHGLEASQDLEDRVKSSLESIAP